MSQQSPATQQAQPPSATRSTGTGTGQQVDASSPQQQGGRTGSQQPAQSAGPGGTLFPSHNFMSEDVRSTSVQLLNQVLADVVVLRSHVKTAHWNVRGPDFYQLHQLFDDVAEMLEGHIDEIAERATALGGIAAGDVHDAVQRTSLPPFPPELVEGQGLIDSVAADIAAVDETLYWEMQRAEELEDLDTVDLLNEVSRDVAKALWFVEAHLQGPGAAASPSTGQFAPRTGQQSGGARQSQSGGGQQSRSGGGQQARSGGGQQPSAGRGQQSWAGGGRQTQQQWQG